MTYLGYCLGEEALQCYAHWTFGSSYLVYGTLLTVSLTLVKLSLPGPHLKAHPDLFSE
jgi:hypothetical protein